MISELERGMHPDAMPLDALCCCIAKQMSPPVPTTFCRGYGVVSFPSEHDLMAAIQGRHGTEIGDPARVVSVRQDQFA